MDRFFYYLLGIMVAVLLTATAVFFSRPREVVEARETTAITEATPAPKATPRPWSGMDPLPMATIAPVALATPPPPTPIPWSPPNLGKTITVGYPGFTAVYAPALGSPVAVQYAMVQGAKPRRYPAPPKVKTPDPKLIPAAGYSRAEMAYAKSIGLYFGKQAGANARLMINICAMDPATLDGPWAQLSEMELRYSSEYKWIEMVAGPIFGNPPQQAGGAVIPVAFYRVYRRSFGDSIAFVIPQGATSIKMESYLTSVAAVETATGIAIFTNTLTPEAREEVAAAIW